MEFKNVKALVFDVDGVFSTNNVYLHPSGEMMRTMSVKDGFALKYASEQGFPIAIITGGFSESVRIRFNNLGINDVYIKSENKMDDYEDFKHKYSLKDSEILYMGDDIPDLEVMKTVGFAVCPADAVAEIKAVSKYISQKEGGNACVREVLEMVLKEQGKWVKTV
ncbi:MAG: HAD-IIIA family hydrolase [Bacteroidetes bacterium]|jgi:3-deoxy-D-manno-octulosonate 8-phosphate phosphatase (KDO 8-P phosphatase)|nr:HAD-IIIA family hydrolase [Bacteroidota bacterium]MBT6687479.1 HAD-IIIA family hydrolase [Bacteroidota bacterium]MBT7142665.1 HAD-IIIA family hydrolase [Bacteroidota bacterium]MBT7491070.1 HAD-IIIA family hydrolase [Bacteroidota bacterium]